MLRRHGSFLILKFTQAWATIRCSLILSYSVMTEDSLQANSQACTWPTLWKDMGDCIIPLTFSCAIHEK